MATGLARARIGGNRPSGEYMKFRLYKQIFLVSLLTLVLTSQISIGEEVTISPNSIKVDRQIIEIVQKADIETFKIDQLFYINNTGNSRKVGR